jgi:lactate permease
MTFLLSLTPIIVILFLMIGLRWGAARAGGAGYLAALLISVLFFGAGPLLLAAAHTKALLLSLDVLLIIWAAFLLYRVADEAGAIRTIGQALPHLTNDRGMLAVIIGWVFASFLQGVGGFGVPVAVVAPLLVGLGFTPLSAVVIPSLGHGWAVTFGSLGSSFQALIAATRLPGEVLAADAAIFLGISAVVVGGMVAHASGGWDCVRRLALPVVLLGTVMGFVQYLLAVARLWNIAAFGGATAGLLLCFPLARRYRGPASENTQALILKDILVALSGYGILVVLILVVQLIPEVRQALSSILMIEVAFPGTETALGYSVPAGIGRRIPLFAHAGSILFFSSVLAFLVYRQAGLLKPGSAVKIARGTVSKVMSSSVSIISMVAMAVIMELAGMTETLARVMAERVGVLFPLAAPWIGAIGAFMTGSNTNSNVVFGMLQLLTAQLLGLSIPAILAGQTAGAGLASVMAPTKVVVGASTAGMAGREGEVMRQLLAYSVVLVLLISGLTLLFVWLQPV